MNHRSPTVLVVDGQVLIRMGIAEFLRSCNFRVVEAGNAEEAIKILRNEEPIHVVFTDVCMPGSLDGFGLAQWVRRERPGVKVILASGVTRTAQAAGDLGDDATFSAKPYDPTQVERCIRLLLAQ